MGLDTEKEIIKKSYLLSFVMVAVAALILPMALSFINFTNSNEFTAEGQFSFMLIIALSFQSKPIQSKRRRILFILTFALVLNSFYIIGYWLMSIIRGYIVNWTASFYALAILTSLALILSFIVILFTPKPSKYIVDSEGGA